MMSCLVPFSVAIRRVTRHPQFHIGGPAAEPLIPAPQSFPSTPPHCPSIDCNDGTPACTSTVVIPAPEQCNEIDSVIEKASLSEMARATIDDLDTMPREVVAESVERNSRGITMVRRALDEYRSQMPPAEPRKLTRTSITVNVLEGTQVPEDQFIERKTPLELPEFDSLCERIRPPEHVAIESEIGKLVDSTHSKIREIKGSLQGTKFVRETEQVDKMLSMLTSVSEEIMPLAQVPDIHRTLEKTHQERVVPKEERMKAAKEVWTGMDDNKILDDEEAFHEADKSYFAAWYDVVNDRSELEDIHKNAEDNSFFERRSCSIEHMIHETSTEIRALDVESERGDADLTCIDNRCAEMEREMQRSVKELSEREVILRNKCEKGRRTVEYIELIMAEYAELHRLQVEENNRDVQEIEFICSEIEPDTGTLALEKRAKLEVAETRKKQLLMLTEDCSVRKTSWSSVMTVINKLAECREVNDYVISQGIYIDDKKILSRRREDYYLEHQTELQKIRNQIIQLLTELSIAVQLYEYLYLLTFSAIKQSECNHQGHLKMSNDDLTLQIAALEEAHDKCVRDAVRGERMQFCQGTENETALPKGSIEVHTKYGPEIWQNAQEVMRNISAARSLQLIETELETENLKMEERLKERERLRKFLQMPATGAPQRLTAGDT
ncbi:hypothetical protein Pelo_13830 [Pelomyxa schiedti]|nr:hypothetical protein Pelo_13830 [Pelomyxa schiedti]